MKKEEKIAIGLLVSLFVTVLISVLIYFYVNTGQFYKITKVDVKEVPEQILTVKSVIATGKYDANSYIELQDDGPVPIEEIRQHQSPNMSPLTLTVTFAEDNSTFTTRVNTIEEALSPNFNIGSRVRRIRGHKEVTYTYNKYNRHHKLKKANLTSTSINPTYPKKVGYEKESDDTNTPWYNDSIPKENLIVYENVEPGQTAQLDLTINSFIDKIERYGAYGRYSKRIEEPLNPTRVILDK